MAPSFNAYHATCGEADKEAVAALRKQQERQVIFRQCATRDRDACLAIIRTNTPDFFAEYEVAEFYSGFRRDRWC
ncbi:hypothetical protein JVX93_15255 [Mycolicibacterium boenickei]|nr:hypothetical protein JVX93_15255 [Mycolicibacterium boenickei]